VIKQTNTMVLCRWWHDKENKKLTYQSSLSCDGGTSRCLVQRWLEWHGGVSSCSGNLGWIYQPLHNRTFHSLLRPFSRGFSSTFRTLEGVLWLPTWVLLHHHHDPLLCFCQRHHRHGQRPRAQKHQQKPSFFCLKILCSSSSCSQTSPNHLHPPLPPSLWAFSYG